MYLKYCQNCQNVRTLEYTHYSYIIHAHTRAAYSVFHLILIRTPDVDPLRTVLQFNGSKKDERDQLIARVRNG